MVRGEKMGRKLISLACIFLTIAFFAVPSDAYCSTIKQSDCAESADRTFEDCFYKSESMFGDMPVGNFDVSESGRLLLCLQQNCINVYDSHGNFEYALNYDTDGSSRAFWQGENIVIYFIRENIFVLLDENCNVSKIYEYTGNDASEFIISLDNTKEITHEGVTYNLSGVRKLMRTDSEGENVIYTYHSDYSMIIKVALIGASVIAVNYFNSKNPRSF